MTVRLLGAAGAIAIALAIEPTSFGLTDPQGKPAGGPPNGPVTTSAAPDSKPLDADAPQEPVTIVLDPTTSSTEAPTFTPPALSMVPSNPKLVRRLTSMLPKDMTVQQAALGFHDQAQFVAAVQISQNLGIPFRQLKRKIVVEGMSLGQAIQALKPDANVTRELSRARGQALQ